MDITELRNKTEGLSAADILKAAADHHPEKTIFTTSFGIEDQVITDIIYRNNIDIKVVTLDTGRLFHETYKVFSATRDKYGKNIEVFYPDTQAVQKMLSEKGPFSFYDSLENRKECCNIRKVEPLKRALNGMECWITGIRADQSSGRTNMHIVEEDKGYNLIKVNPLMSWTINDVMEYLEKNNVPYNSLHHKGYISIGCAPCTRAVRDGEDFRAGRWWWENNSGKECGLHTHGK